MCVKAGMKVDILYEILPIGRLVGRSLAGRVSDNGPENTQIENSRANFPVLGSLNGAN